MYTAIREALELALRNARLIDAEVPLCDLPDAYECDAVEVLEAALAEADAVAVNR